ncbi:MAG: RIP metalloprotease RseP [Alistipes sp.]|nr:RIP metalloprotease RseP [Alistipes sp.]
MDILIKIVQFILSFSLLILIHEFGHFLFAKLFKTRVEKFYLFFNPWFSLFKFKRGETEYGLGWVPFGGYVKISGMIDESMDKEQMKQPAQPYEFRAKPAWQRLLIMVGGVVMNVILALLIYMGLSYFKGDTYLENQNVKYGYTFNEVAEELGFRDGDRILDVAGEPVHDTKQILPMIAFDQASYVTVEREGAPVRIAIPQEVMPRLLDSPDFVSVRIPFVIGDVEPKSGAQQAGLQKGDTIVSFNGTSMRYYDQLSEALKQSASHTVELGFMRDSAGITRLMTQSVAVSAEGKIGVYLTPMDQMFNLTTRHYTLLESIPAGFHRTGEKISSYAKQIKLIFMPETEAYKSLGGVLMLGSIFPSQWSWEEFWNITAFLSIVLAVMNILPIPALDGGHVLFLLVEVVTRRRPSDKFLERAQVVGMMLLFALMIFATWNDIYRLFIK